MLHCNLLSAKLFREVRLGWQRSLVTMTAGHQKIQSQWFEKRVRMLLMALIVDSIW